MIVYRICAERFSSQLMASGRPNRWNEANQWVLYTSMSRSLAVLELLAHRNMEIPKERYRCMVIELPDEYFSVEIVPSNIALKNNFENYLQHQKLGSAWYQSSKSLCLQVPSILVPKEHNMVIHTMHPNFSVLRILDVEEFELDERLEVRIGKR